MINLRKLLKRSVQALFFLCALLPAVLCGFGRVELLFTLFAQYFALWPGFIGSFARAAFYNLTLESCSIDVVIGLGSYFSRRAAVVRPNVSIGSYCVIGRALIGARTQISSHVEIPGGRAQHVRGQLGRLSNALEDSRPVLTIGEDCWIGAGVIIMANIGAQSTIGAGSVVVHEIPAGVVAVGAPAKAGEMMANQKTSAPIPVLLVVRALESGGIERDVAKLALGFSRDHWVPYVATFKPAGPRFDELTAAGVPILHLDLTSIASLKALRAALQMRRLIRDKKIQVVHAFDTSAAFAVPVARLLRVPVVLSSTLGSRALLDPKSQKLVAFNDKYVDAVVVNCEAMRIHLENDWAVPRDHIEICYNGVDTNEFYPDTEATRPEYAGSSIVIGAVCVLRPEKNLTLLQAAFAKVRHLSPNPKLVIVGSGPELDKLKENSQRLGIAANSDFVPGLPRVASFMRTMDIFVSCSYSEAFSNSILEAMACGCCVVGSRVGGTPELISDAERGLLFTSNDPNDLADKLARLIQEPELRKQFGSRAAHFALTKLNMAVNLERTGEIYRKFLRQKKVIA